MYFKNADLRMNKLVGNEIHYSETKAKYLSGTQPHPRPRVSLTDMLMIVFPALTEKSPGDVISEQHQGPAQRL